MRLGEIDHRLADIGIDEGAGCGNPQLALEIGIVLAHQVRQAVDLLEDIGGGAVIGMAGLGHRELPGRAVQQQRAQIVLELAHIFRQQRLGTTGTSRCG
jgi:hypothetical protein